MFMFFDPLYLAIILFCGLLSLIAAGLTKSRFASAKKVPIRSGHTGRDIAAMILRDQDIDDVNIVEHAGFLSDHYNPQTKTLALSADVYHGRTAAAAGIAAHEVGHAIQHARDYGPLKMRSMLVPMANIGSNIGPWIIIIAIFMGAAQGSGMGHNLAVGGVILFGMSTLFTFVTLPVEFDASSRAKVILEQLNITQSREEDKAVAGVLNAAALTYVAAAVSSLMMLAYWAFRAGLIGGRD